MPNPSASQCHPSSPQLELPEPHWDEEEHLYHSRSRGSGSGWSHSGTSRTWNKTLASAGLRHSNPWGQGRAWELGWERWELGSQAKLLLPRACPRWRPGDTGQLPVVTPRDLGSRSAPSPLLLCPFPRMSPQTPCPEPCEPCGFPSTPRVSFLPQSHRIPVPISLPSLEQPGAPPHPQIPPSRRSQPAWGTRIFGIRFPVIRAGLLGATSQGLLGNKSLKEPRGLLGYTSRSRGGP